MRTKIAQISVVLATIFSTLGFAQDNPSLTPTKTQGQTQFISGGIGQDESEAIFRARSSWPLMLELTQSAGAKPEYISDAQITIKDELRNIVLDTNAEGPYLLVKLPTGKYFLEATHNSVTLRRNLNIQKGSGKKITLVWPAAKND